MNVLCFAVGVIIGLLLQRREHHAAGEEETRSSQPDKELQRQLKQLRALERYTGMPQDEEVIDYE